MIETKRAAIDELQQKLTIDTDALVRSVAFIEWAGKDWPSRRGVITEAGKPVIFYHGGRGAIEEFDRSAPRNTAPDQHGFYFTPRMHTARFFADQLRAEQEETDEVPQASIYAVCLKMEHPYIIKNNDALSSMHIEQLPEGYDGFINPQAQEVVVLKPDQIFIAAEIPR